MRKTYLALSSAAALLAFASVANAADAADVSAPVVPEPTSYVKVCDAFGTGYFYIPGTETCLRIGGQISASVGYDHFHDEKYSAVEGFVDVDTASDTELGALKTKLRYASRENLDQYTFFGLPYQQQQIDLAYIELAGVKVGYQETMFDTRVGYGDMLDMSTVFNVDMNTTALSYMSGDLGNGVYVGASVEDYLRGGSIGTRVWGDESPDFVGRVGMKDQAWGNVDLSGIYSDRADLWFLKATTDINAFDNTQFRLSAGYGQFGSDNQWLLAGAVKYDFTSTISGFAGASYQDSDAASVEAVWTANGGVVWSPVENLDVKAEVIYTDAGSVDNYNPKLSFTRSW